MIDQDRDGFITKTDLAGMFSSMGKDPPETYLEDVIKNAFKCFDPEKTGVINGDELKRLLMAMGERFTAEEATEMFDEQECDDAGNFDYLEFTRLIKHGPRDEE